MIATTREERHWFLRTVAMGLLNSAGHTQPPIQVEEMLKHPPQVYDTDFGVVDMYSNLWDATFARPPSKRGSVFVRIDLPPAQRRYALAREMLSALITSDHGRQMGLESLFLDDIQDAAEYFARAILAPETMVEAYRQQGGGSSMFAKEFGLPEDIAELCWTEHCALHD